jgi:hypothetical protein
MSLLNEQREDEKTFISHNTSEESSTSVDNATSAGDDDVKQNQTKPTQDEKFVEEKE